MKQNAEAMMDYIGRSHHLIKRREAMSSHWVQGGRDEQRPIAIRSKRQRINEWILE